MADGIDEAAAAFDVDMGRSEAPAPRGIPKGEVRNEGPPERMFENVGNLEVDDDSPAKAGGDDDDALYNFDEEDEGDGKTPKEGEEDENEDENEDEGEGNDVSDEEFYAQEVTVTVDGEPQTVTLKEALEGYTRTATFHQRMNDVEEAKKVIARTAADAVHNYEAANAMVEQMREYMKTLVPPEPDWDAEFKANPVRAREMQKQYEHLKAFQKTLDDKSQEAARAAAKTNATQLAAFAETEARKFDSMNAKQWADPKRKQKDLQSMRRTALGTGFTEEEISQVYDSRMLTILLKASKYDRMMASKPKPVSKDTGKTIASKGGTRRGKSNGRVLSKAMQNLNKTGKVADAAVVFDQIIAREG